MNIASSGLRTAIFADGKKLGESTLAWSPFHVEFEVGEREHEIVIRVDNLLENHPLFREFYDFYGFGGIYDHVTLEELVPGEIRSLQVLPLDHQTGEVEIHVDTNADTLRLSFDGRPAETIPVQKSFRRFVPEFQLWSLNSPHLHRLTVNEKTIEFGIRTFDWSGKQLLLNGEALKLIGVNRHESHPEFGAATPESLIASDLLQIKNAGFNFIRGCHYPQRDFMLSMCDRLGLLVWEEPLAWGNNASYDRPKDFTEGAFMDTLAEQLELTIRRSINHPSLMIHGFLNECASNLPESRDAVKRLMNICHRLDSTRPAAFASNRPWEDICFDLTDLCAINVYPGWYSDMGIDSVAPALDKVAEKLRDKPLIISEIGASAIRGDHSGMRWSEEYQAELCSAVAEKVLRDSRFSGVAFWQFADANTYINNTMALTRPRGFNNKGLVDEYRRPKMAWNTLSKGLPLQG